MKTVTSISDLHIGSSLGLCSTNGFPLDEGGAYSPSRLQGAVWDKWSNDFFRWVDKRSSGADQRLLVINGDIVDGFHHNTVAIATNNIAMQEFMASEILAPVCREFDRVFVVRGTEAHVQQSAQSEERIAKDIKAVQNDDGRYSWWQLWLDVDGVIFNFAHHIGTTSSAAYESSAVMRELAAALVESGQWGQHVPDVIVRSHRHRYIRVSIPSIRGEIQAVVTPGWQLRTPFVERIDRMRLPHIGGVLFKVEDGVCLTEARIYPFKNPEPMIV